MISLAAATLLGGLATALTAAYASHKSSSTSEKAINSSDKQFNKQLSLTDSQFQQQMQFLDKQHSDQLDFSNRQLADNSRIADMNFGLQQDAFNYQKMLNATQMEREDNAIRRQIADYQAAGFSPLAAIGGSGAGSAALSSGSAPQYDMSGVNAAYGQYADFARQYAQLKIAASQNYMNNRSSAASAHNASITGSRLALSQMKSDMYYRGATIANQAFDSFVNARYKDQEYKRLKFENDWYEAHGYQHVTLATVVSDFLNKGEVKEAINKFTDLVGQGLSAVANGAAEIAEAIKNHKGSTLQFSVNENKGMVKDLSKDEYSFVLEYADRINKPYYEWDLTDWLNCAAAEQKARKGK